MTAKYAHVVDMATKNPALFIPDETERRRIMRNPGIYSNIGSVYHASPLTNG
jgi:hypothetical protein